ncbi:MAG: beta/alpha barrel domain-containing protein [Candidatus Xenobia bacterium]
MTTYRFDASYDDNYVEGPCYAGPPPARAAGGTAVEVLGRRLAGPLGIFSGPLLNARWVSLYAQLGFDLLAYKTVRSQAWPSHPLPNCAFVQSDMLSTRQAERPQFLVGTGTPHPDPAHASMTNSFGMPSRAPDVWQKDVQTARASLGPQQGLIVSVVGRDVADYVHTARLAAQAGAHAVEVNLSCPNVVTGEGCIYLDPIQSGLLAREVSLALGGVPLIIKLGYIEDSSLLARVLGETAPYIAAVSGINTVSMEVRSEHGEPLLGADRRKSGICGEAIRACGLHFTEMVANWRARERAPVALLMGGGIMQPEHADEYLARGADVAMVATGAMLDPHLALAFHQRQHAAPLNSRP